jgi:F-type H+-transporting ATPase subunit b
LMARLALPRVGAILENRRLRIEGDLAAAQRLKDESDAAVAAYEKALADARGRAQTLANETRQRAAAEAEAGRKSLDATLNARIDEAEKVIADKRAAAMLNVKDIATEAAAAIVERLIGVAPAGQQVAAAVADQLRR